MRKEHRLALAIAALAVAGCRQGTSSPDTTLDVPGTNSSIPSIPTPDFSTPIPNSYPTATPTPPLTIEFSPTPEVKLINPYKGKVWNQRCLWIRDATGKIIGKTCAEPWADTPLPGGCKDPLRRDLFTAGCNVAATTYMINLFASAEEIAEITGQPGLTPEDLVNVIYPLATGKLMSCNGAGPEVIVPALKLFGFRIRKDINISKYSAAGFIKNLRINQKAMFFFNGNKTWAGTPFFEHVSVPVGVTKDGKIAYADSFYYPPWDDPLHPTHPDWVVFEDSLDIHNIQLVGALLVNAPYRGNLPLHEVDGGLLQLEINLLPPEAKSRMASGGIVVAAAKGSEHGWHGQTSITDIFRYNGKPAIHGDGYDILTMGEFHHTDALPGPSNVVEVGYMPNGYGNYVIIHNEDTGIDILYAHLERVYVKEGQLVDKQTIIGTTGKSGGGATAGAHGGYHTHMEIFYNGEAIKMNWWSNPN